MSNREVIEAMIAERKAKEAAKATELKTGQTAADDSPGCKAGNGSGQGAGGDRDELMQMCAEVDLLALIQADTGETGRKSGDRYDFHNCPVCGHHDDFSYYKSTGSWSCFGGSNTNAKAGKVSHGGNVLDYLQYARGMTDATERVKWLREATGHPYEPKPKDDHTGAHGAQEGGQGDQDGPKLLLPPWGAIRATEPPKRNGVLIEGILRRGHVALLAAKGKAGKSWSAIQLSIAVATGGEWFGCKCERGEVLYLDPEIDRKSLDNRFAEVCKAMDVDAAEIDAHVSKWPLRGVAGANMKNIVHDLELRCTFGCFALVVIDSCSVFVEGDENSSVDIRKFAAKVLRVAAITGASVLLIQHYGKGNAGDRDTADRARGSSVWLDFPDATLFLTETFPPSGETGDYLQDGERAFLLETGGLREFPAMEPKRLIYSFPTHRVDAEGITDGWKPTNSQRKGADKANELKAAQKDARNAETVAALLAHYYAEGIGEDGLILKEAAEAVNLDSRQLATALEGCEHFELVQVTQRKRYVRPKHAPRASPSELPLSDD